MEQSRSRAAPATVEHGVGPTTAGGADASTAPRPRTSRGENGSQRTLSRLLVFAVLGSARGAATVEEHLQHVRDGLALSKVRMRHELCADFLVHAAAPRTTLLAAAICVSAVHMRACGTGSEKATGREKRMLGEGTAWLARGTEKRRRRGERRSTGLLHYGEAVSRRRTAGRREGGEVGSVATGSSCGRSWASSSRSSWRRVGDEQGGRERETRRLSLSFLRYEGTEMRDRMGVVIMGWAAREQDDECWPQQRACF